MEHSLLAVTFGANERGIILFGFEIYYYAICIVCGMILAAFLSALLMKRRNMSVDLIYLLFIVCIPTAIICARLFSCLTDPDLGIGAFFAFRRKAARFSLSAGRYFFSIQKTIHDKCAARTAPFFNLFTLTAVFCSFFCLIKRSFLRNCQKKKIIGFFRAGRFAIARPSVMQIKYRDQHF